MISITAARSRAISKCGSDIRSFVPNLSHKQWGRFLKRDSFRTSFGNSKDLWPLFRAAIGNVVPMGICLPKRLRYLVSHSKPESLVKKQCRSSWTLRFWHILSIRQKKPKPRIIEHPEEGGIMTAKEWKETVRDCPNAQGFRCTANGSMCRPENCAFFFLSKAFDGSGCECE